MHLLGKIAILLGVYKLRILAVRDCFTDLSTILQPSGIVLAKFLHMAIDGSARSRLTSFNYNHTPHAGTLPSRVTGHSIDTITWTLLYQPDLRSSITHFNIKERFHMHMY